jgi:hypothetical protein
LAYLKCIVDECKAAPRHFFGVLDLDEQESLPSKQVVSQVNQGQFPSLHFRPQPRDKEKNGYWLSTNQIVPQVDQGQFTPLHFRPQPKQSNNQPIK